MGQGNHYLSCVVLGMMATENGEHYATAHKQSLVPLIAIYVRCDLHAGWLLRAAHAGKLSAFTAEHQTDGCEFI